MKGIITIAVGEPIYGQMAINLAMSIRNKSKLPIDIIYTESSFKGFEWGLDLFEKKHLVVSDNPTKLAMKLKLMLNEYSRFDTTIFLDCDTIICPSRSVDDIALPAGLSFTAQNYGLNRLGDKPNKIYEHWLDYENTMRLFPLLKKETNIPQINSSLLIWRATNVFSVAQDVCKLLSLSDSGKRWRGEIPDEVCFNIACALTGDIPHKKTFRPLYIGGDYSKEYIIDSYVGLSMVGKRNDWRQVDAYNDFAKYYAELNGLVEPILFGEKVKKSKPLIPHVKNVLARIGGFGAISEGGIINPSVWRANNQYKAILRCDANLEGYKGRKDKAKCVPILATYDLDFNLVKAEAITLSGIELMEDFRIYMNTEAIIGCCSVWDGKKWGQRIFYISDGKLRTLTTYYSEKDEKNWAWFYHKRDLHVYSVEPFIVRDHDLQDVVNVKFDSGWREKGFISCSTFPVKYGEDYLMWVHKKQSDLTYLNSVMIFDGKTLLPKYFIPHHVLGTEGIDQPLYISSCVVEDDRIIIFGGEGGIEEMSNAALKSATMRIIDRKTFDNIIKQYPCTDKNFLTN